MEEIDGCPDEGDESGANEKTGCDPVYAVVRDAKHNVILLDGGSTGKGFPVAHNSHKRSLDHSQVVNFLQMSRVLHFS